MAINTADWSHKLYIPDSYIPGSSQLGMPLLITQDVIANLVDSNSNPAADTFWNTVQNGGGDIRCCANEDGTGQYPVEVPGDNVSTTAKTGHWWVYRPYSGAGGVWVFFGKPGETQPPVTDPFGRNAVWGDFSIVIHEGSDVDSTGNTTPILNGSPTLAAGVFGQGYDLQSASQCISIPDGAFTTFENRDYAVDVWSNVASSTGNLQTIIDKTQVSNDKELRFFKNNGGNTRHRTPNLSNQNMDFFVEFGQVRDSIDLKSGTKRLIINDDVKRSESVTGTIASTSEDLVIGSSGQVQYTLGGVLSEVWIQFDTVRSDTQRSTEYANQNDPATFYGTPVVYEVGGGGGSAQSITLVTAEQAETASTISIAEYMAINSVAAEQIEEAAAVNATAAQGSNLIEAEQSEQASPFDVAAHQLLNAITAEQREQANAISIEQSGSQSVNLLTCEQVEESQTLTVQQQQALTTIVAQQMEHAELVSPASVQAVTMLVAEQREEASPINVQQYTGQLVTLIAAEQVEQGQTVFISQVNAADIINAEQREQAQTLGVTQRQSLIQISAEQVEEAEILRIISAGDQTDLSGLTLIPITEAYSLTPINVETYSLEEI